MGGCFQYLSPAVRHVYSSASAPEERYVYSSDTLIVRAPEERNVYHTSGVSSESKTYFGCIEECQRLSFARTERHIYNGRLFPVFIPSGAACL